MIGQNKIQDVLDAIHTALGQVGGVICLERNADLPQEVPDDALIILRDGAFGDTQEVMGGFDPVYITHFPDIEVIVSGSTAEERDAKYNAIIKEIADILVSDRTLGGLVFGLTIQTPKPAEIPIEGAASVKAAVITVRVEYESPTALG